MKAKLQAAAVGLFSGLVLAASIALIAKAFFLRDPPSCLEWEEGVGDVCTTHGRTSAAVCRPVYRCVRWEEP